MSISNPLFSIDEEYENTGDELLVGALLGSDRNFDLLQELIQSSPEFFTLKSNKLVNLAIAQSADPCKALQVLVDGGADINKPYNGSHHLVSAARRGLTDVVIFLLARGADPEVRSFRERDERLQHTRRSFCHYLSAEAVAKEEGHYQIAQIIHTAKHRKQGGDYEALTVLIDEITTSSGGNAVEVLSCIKTMVQQGNECIECANQDGITLYEVLFQYNLSESIQYLVNENKLLDNMPQNEATNLAFKDDLSPECFKMLLDLKPSLTGSVKGVPLIQYLVQKNNFEKLDILLSKLETHAMATDKHSLPIDISLARFSGTGILNIALERGNTQIVLRILDALSQLEKTGKIKFSGDQVVNFVYASSSAERQQSQCCLQILIHSNVYDVQEKVRLLKAFVDMGADPNIHLGYRVGVDNQQIPVYPLTEASQCGPHRLSLVESLLELGAEDFDQWVLKSALETEDTQLCHILLSFSCPATKDTAYPIHHGSKLLVNLPILGFIKQPLADNKVLFYRIPATLTRPRRYSQSFRITTHVKKFTLEPLQVSFCGIKHLVRIDSELVMESVLRNCRKSPELYACVTVSGNFSQMLRSSLVELITTLKIENCESIEDIESRFFTDFKSLKHLTLSCNPSLTSLPEEIDPEQSSIEELDLSNNKLGRIPTWVFCLRTLRKLTVRSNCLDKLPKEFWFAPTLQHCDLSFNADICTLPDLDDLCEGGRTDHCERPCNKSLSDSRSKGSSYSLQSSSSSTENEVFNSINDPDNFEFVPREVLRVHRPRFKHVSFFESNYNVVEDSNPERKCNDEDELSCVSRLLHLDVSNCGLTEIPRNLACLAPKLTRLNCSWNRIQRISIPEQFPPAIEELDFEHNQISQMDFLRSQVIKCVHRNEPVKLSEEVLSAMQRNNSIFADSFIQRCPHTSHYRLESLKYLYLSSNKELEDVEFDYLRQKKNFIEPVTRLPALQCLQIANCNLFEISDSISRLTNLRSLSVSNNDRITSIPEDLSRLTNLTTLDVRGCKIGEKEFLCDNLREATEKILLYLSSKREEKISSRQMKLIVTGDEASGKSQLVKALRRSNGISVMDGILKLASRQHGEGPDLDSTWDMFGINVNNWFTSGNENAKRKPIFFDVWEFAGNHANRVIQQFFYSQRCIYIVTFSLVKEANTKNGRRCVIRTPESLTPELNAWIGRICSRVPDASFILVGTKKDLALKADGYFKGYFAYLSSFFQQNLRVPQNDSPKKSNPAPLPNILFVGLKSYKDDQIFALVDHIWTASSTVRSHPPLGNASQNAVDVEIPKRFKIVDEWLQSTLLKTLPEPILKEHQFKKEIDMFFRESKMRPLADAEFTAMAQYLHDAGTILHYEATLLSGIFFLDPLWFVSHLSNVVKAIGDVTQEAPGLANVDNFREQLERVSHVNKSKCFKHWPKLVIPLLSQFDVALRISNQYLLFPAYLPLEREQDTTLTTCLIKEFPCIPTSHQRQAHNAQDLPFLRSAFSDYEVIPSEGEFMDFSRSVLRVNVDALSSSDRLCKFMLFPSIPYNFWGRITARFLSDSQFSKSVVDVFDRISLDNEENTQEKLYPAVEYALHSGLSWRVWKTGLTLMLWGQIPLFELKEVLSDALSSTLSIFSPHKDVTIKRQSLLNQSHVICHVLSQSTNQFADFRDSTIENIEDKKVLLIQVLAPTFEIFDKSRPQSSRVKMSLKAQFSAQMFEQISQHVDALLTEWFPYLDKGRLDAMVSRENPIERLIPCGQCLFTLSKPLLPKSEIFLRVHRDDVEEFHAHKHLSGQELQREVEISVTTPEIRLHEQNDECCSSNIETSQTDCDSRAGSQNLTIKNTLMKSNSVEPFSEESESNSNAKDVSPHRRKTVVCPSRISRIDESELINYEEAGSPRSTIDSGTIPDLFQQPTRKPTLNKQYSETFAHPIRDDTSSQPRLYCFVEAELILLAFSGLELIHCPNHGEVSLEALAPNFFFRDLPPEKVFSAGMIEIGKYKGQGCFGAVFNGSVKTNCFPSERKLSVAYKIYQPLQIQGRFQTPEADKSCIEGKAILWKDKPLVCVASAYNEMRKEVSVLVELQNPFMVTFRGVSISPVALMLDEAPLGNLTSQLNIYVAENALLPSPVIKEILIQVASAIDHMHRHEYVHRDLKTDNILVWKFPGPHKLISEIEDGSVLVRLSDYGLAQREVSNELRGVPGTANFMAPEILSDDGRGLYSNKIDIYSFGMIIYNLVCLVEPWRDNYHNFQSWVIQNKRPRVTTGSKQCPVAFLDIMCVCTLSKPQARPTAQSIVEILNEAETCKLIECVRTSIPVDYQVSNMGISILPGDGGPQGLITVAIYSTDAVKNWKQFQNSEKFQSFEVTLLFYKGNLRDSITLHLNFKDATDENITALVCVYNEFWCCTLQGSVMVFQVEHGQLRLKASNLFDDAGNAIYHLVLADDDCDFSCVAVVTSSLSIYLMKYARDIERDSIRPLDPRKVGTIEITGFEEIHGLCLVTTGLEESKAQRLSTTSSFSIPITPTSDFPSVLHVPDNLELWVSGEKGCLKRFKVNKNSRTSHRSCDELLYLEAIYPSLKHDPKNLFGERLSVDIILAVNDCHRVWTADSKNRYICMWNVDTFEVTAVNCSFKEENLNEGFQNLGSFVEVTSPVVRVNDLKALKGCVYAALSNGYVIVFDATSAVQLNCIKSNTVETFRVIPLIPIIAPPRSQLKEHYQSIFLRKNPLFLTLGIGHKIAVSKAESSSESETDMDNLISAADSSSSPAKIGTYLKLWNMFGDVWRSGQSALAKPETVLERRRGYSLVQQLNDTEAEHLATEQDLDPTKRILRYLRRVKAVKNQPQTKVLDQYPLPQYQPGYQKYANVSCVDGRVEVIRFELTEVGYRLKSNGISIDFQKGCLRKDCKASVIVIITDPPPAKACMSSSAFIIHQERDELSIMSPVVNILLEPDIDFLEPLIIRFPLPHSENAAFHTRVHTGFDAVSNRVFAIEDNKYFRKSQGVFEFEYREFSAPICMVSASTGIAPPPYLDYCQLFPDNLSVLLFLLSKDNSKNKSRACYVVCFDLPHFLKAMRFLPFNSVHFQEVSTPSSECKLKISVQGQSILMEGCANELAVFKDIHVEASHSIHYRVNVQWSTVDGIHGRRSREKEIFGEFSIKETNDVTTKALKLLKNSISSTGYNWCVLLKALCLDFDSVRELVKVDHKNVLIAVSRHLETKDFQSFLCLLLKKTQFEDGLKLVSRREELINLMMDAVEAIQFDKEFIGKVLRRIKKFENSKLSNDATFYTLHIAAEWLIRDKRHMPAEMEKIASKAERMSQKLCKSCPNDM